MSLVSDLFSLKKKKKKTSQGVNGHEYLCKYRPSFAATSALQTTLSNYIAEKGLLLLLLLKKIGNARLGEGDCHPISPKTPAPHYQPIEEKKRN